jgi:hypothetical protein
MGAGLKPAPVMVPMEEESSGLSTGLAIAACVLVWLGAGVLAANYFANISLM